jgi:hypothetical protein
MLRGTRHYSERQATMLDASNIPSLIVGAVAAYAWGQRQNRRGGR